MGLALVGGLFFSLQNCQYSDICAQETPDTPKLVVKFYDAQSPGSVKIAEDFNLREISDTAFYFDEPLRDSIFKVPLQTNQKETLFEVVYFQDDENKIQKDTIKISYEPEKEYISRACGFKVTYTDLEAEINSAHPGWIQQIEIADTTKTIKNETEAHLYIFY